MIGPAVDALLPPAVLAVLAFILIVSGRRRAALYALVALVLFATQGVPHLLIAPLLLPNAPPDMAPDGAPGAVVVLASGLPGLLDTSRTTPGLETLTRLRTAAALSRSKGLPILVSGGRPSNDPVPVASSMALSLAGDFGVRATWTETQSANIWQSAAAIAAILRKAGITTIYLVAQPWEMRLSVSVFRASGLTVVPASIPHADQRPLDLTAVVVITPAWLDSTIALRQWLGLACQALAPCVSWMAGPTRDSS